MIFPSRFLIVVCLCFLLVSCGQKKEIPSTEAAIPADSLISPEKMIHIMADVHVVEAALMLQRNKDMESRTNADFYYQGIFKKNHISQSRFNQNLKYYSQNTSEFVKMYDKMIQELENRQKSFSHVK